MLKKQKKIKWMQTVQYEYIKMSYPQNRSAMWIKNVETVNKIGKPGKWAEIVVGEKRKYGRMRKNMCPHAEKNAYSIDETHFFCYVIVCLD